jgi:autotransporter family porin
VLSTNKPLTAEAPDPALAVRSNREPLPDAPVPDEYPVDTTTRPPVPAANDEDPPDKTTSPPDPLLPAPTVTYTDPPRPLVAEPLPTYTPPLSPELDVPVLSTINPLTPAVPAFAVRTPKDPLLVADPYPVVKVTPPPLAPDAPDVAPADRTILPPDPLFPKPTLM